MRMSWGYLHYSNRNNKCTKSIAWTHLSAHVHTAFLLVNTIDTDNSKLGGRENQWLTIILLFLAFYISSIYSSISFIVTGIWNFAEMKPNSWDSMIFIQLWNLLLCTAGYCPEKNNFPNIIHISSPSFTLCKYIQNSDQILLLY